MSYLQSLIVFAQLSLFSFGGIFSFWSLTEECLNRNFSQCQDLPLSAEPGSMHRIIAASNLLPGPQVAAVMLLTDDMWLMLTLYIAILLPGFVIVPILVKAYQKLHTHPLFLQVNEAIVYAVAIILLIFTFKLVRGFVQDFESTALGAIIFLASFGLQHKFKVSPLTVIAIAGLATYIYEST